MRRLRKRLDSVQAHAEGTLAALRDLAMDLQDGVTVRFVSTGCGHTVLDFLAGRCDELPIRIVIDASDDDGTKESH